MQMFVNNNLVSADLNDDLARAVVISLFSWHRAEEGDIYDGSKKYGWWGDSFNNYKTGSKLWQYLRKSLTTETILGIKETCEDALRWLIDDNIADSVTVTPERSNDDINCLNLTVDIALKDLSSIQYKFEEV